MEIFIPHDPFGTLCQYGYTRPQISALSFVNFWRNCGAMPCFSSVQSQRVLNYKNELTFENKSSSEAPDIALKVSSLLNKSGGSQVALCFSHLAVISVDCCDLEISRNSNGRESMWKEAQRTFCRLRFLYLATIGGLLWVASQSEVTIPYRIKNTTNRLLSSPALSRLEIVWDGTVFQCFVAVGQATISALTDAL